MYIEKHCTHVPMSGIINFFCCIKSAVFTRIMLPSGDGREVLPLAERNSEKSMYFPERICCLVLGGIEGTPYPTEIWGQEIGVADEPGLGGGLANS